LKGRYLISLLLPLLLLCGSCTQQTEKKALPEKIAREKPAAAKNKPLKIIHLTGEAIRVNPKAGKLTVRGKDGEVEIYATDKTIIRIGRDNGRLSDIAAGDKATVKYFEIDGKYVARNIFIVREDPDENESPKAEISPLKASKKSAPDQPSDSSSKA
jgi:hypothetical protein